MLELNISQNVGIKSKQFDPIKMELKCLKEIKNENKV